jgi:hypothetical protein
MARSRDGLAAVLTVPSLRRSSYPALESDLTVGQGGHQVLDRGVQGEDALAVGINARPVICDALVVGRDLVVQLVELGSELAIRGKDLPERDEGPHRQDAHFHGPGRAQHRGNHERAVLP